MIRHENKNGSVNVSTSVYTEIVDFMSEESIFSHRIPIHVLLQFTVGSGIQICGIEQDICTAAYIIRRSECEVVQELVSYTDVKLRYDSFILPRL